MLLNTPLAISALGRAAGRKLSSQLAASSATFFDPGPSSRSKRSHACQTAHRREDERYPDSDWTNESDLSSESMTSDEDEVTLDGLDDGWETDLRLAQLYELVNKRWSHRHAGFCKGHYDRKTSTASLIIRSQSGCPSVIFRTNIVNTEQFFRRNDRRITWKEPSGAELALVFWVPDGWLNMIGSSSMTSRTLTMRSLNRAEEPWIKSCQLDEQSFDDLNVIQQWLDGNVGHPDRLMKIKKLLDCAAQHEWNLPPSLFISGVTTDPAGIPVAGGNFADIFIGSYCGQRVAVKRFRAFASDCSRNKLRKRFCREALLWRQLKHSRILPLLGIDEDALRTHDALVIISPWMAQGTLLEYLENHRMVLASLKSLIRDIADGIKYLHNQRFAHGDLHGVPSNVFIDKDNRALLGDFGLTAVADISFLAATTSVNKAGAIRWLAPELIHQDDDRPPPRKTLKGDIFAFGRLCLCIYTRRVPYHTIATEAGVLLRVIQNRQPSRPLPEECQGNRITSSLWSLINQCWTSDPEARPSIDDILLALGAAF